MIRVGEVGSDHFKNFSSDIQYLDKSQKSKLNVMEETLSLSLPSLATHDARNNPSKKFVVFIWCKMTKSLLF
jgi:hypothetical protein